MPIGIMQWRVEIEMFNVRFFKRCKSNALGPLTSLLYTIAGISITLLSTFLLLRGDVELNPGPNKKRNFWFNFSICHWNLNSLTARNFEKNSYNTVNKFVIIHLSDTFIDSSILTENNNLKLNGYKMVKADHPNNVKRGSVCAYVRASLPVRNFSNSYLSKCLAVTTTNYKGLRYYFI